MKATIRTAATHASTLLLAFGAGVAITEMRSSDESWIEEKKDLLRFMSVVHVEDGLGGTYPTVLFTGANVQIVNGLGSTNGYPDDFSSVDALETVTNGVGNLIVGYNEDTNDPFLQNSAKRNGSHNIIGGIGASYASFGGVVLGRKNTMNGPYAGILGGFDNRATGPYSTILGGGGFDSGTSQGNLATGEFSTIAGGSFNSAIGQISHVCGGFKNKATARQSVVVGCSENRASGNDSVVLSGTGNTSSGAGSCVAGGFSNKSAGKESAVSGGQDNLASATRSAISGGISNKVSGANSVISGGRNRSVNGEDDWAAGSLFEED